MSIKGWNLTLASFQGHHTFGSNPACTQLSIEPTEAINLLTASSSSVCSLPFDLPFACAPLVGLCARLSRAQTRTSHVPACAL